MQVETAPDVVAAATISAAAQLSTIDEARTWASSWRRSPVRSTDVEQMIDGLLIVLRPDGSTLIVIVSEGSNRWREILTVISGRRCWAPLACRAVDELKSSS